MSLLNASTRSGFSVPAFISLRCCLTHDSKFLFSTKCLEGFRLFVSMKALTSSYRFCQRSSCVIFLFCMLRHCRDLSSSPFPTIHRRLHLRPVLSGFAAEIPPPSRPGCQESMPTHCIHHNRYRSLFHRERLIHSILFGL